MSSTVLCTVYTLYTVQMRLAERQNGNETHSVPFRYGRVTNTTCRLAELR